MLSGIDHNMLEMIILIALSLIGLFFKRQFAKWDARDADERERAEKRDDDVKKQLDKMEELREANFALWKTEVNAHFCDIKNSHRKFIEDLHGRVPYEHCVGRMDKIDERLRNVGG